MDMTKLSIEDQLIISLAAVDLDGAKRILPDHRIFTDEVKDLVVTWVGGACPTQSEGTMNGQPYYFRARHGNWDLHMGGKAHIFEPEMVISGNDPTVGWMEDGDVIEILRNGARIFSYLIEQGAIAEPAMEEEVIGEITT